MVSVLTEKLVLTFDSVNYAMQAEKAFKEDEVEFKTIPTPREISSSCGLSIMTSLDNTEYASKKRRMGLISISFGSIPNQKPARVRNL